MYVYLVENRIKNRSLNNYLTYFFISSHIREISSQVEKNAKLVM